MKDINNFYQYIRNLEVDLEILTEYYMDFLPKFNQQNQQNFPTKNSVTILNHKI